MAEIPPEHEDKGHAVSAFSKNWIQFFTSKRKNGRTQYNKDKSLLENFTSWSGNVKGYTHPFNKGFFSSLTVSNPLSTMQEQVASNRRKGIILTMPEQISLNKKLPLSGKIINISNIKGLYYIEASKFDYSDSTFYTMFGDLNHKIISFRNKRSKTDERFHFSYKAMEFIAHSTKIAHIMGRQIDAMKNLASVNEDGEIALEIDRDYLRLLFALETLHPHVIAAELYKNMCNLLAYSHQLELLFWALGEQEGSTIKTQLSEFKNGIQNFRDSLSYAGNTQIPNDGKLSRRESPESPAHEATEFIAMIEQNRIADIVFQKPSMSVGILSYLNYKDPVLRSDDPYFKHLNNWTNSFISLCFSLMGPSDTKSIDQRELKIDDSLLHTLLKAELEFTDINSQTYNRESLRIDHLKKSIGENIIGHSKELARMSSLIQKSIVTLSESDLKSLPSWVDCIRYNPTYINEIVVREEINNDADARWKNALHRFEFDILGTEPKESIISIAKTHGIEEQELHKTLVDLIVEMTEVRNRYNTYIGSLNTSNSLTRDVAKDTRKKMQEAYDGFKHKYLQYKKSFKTSSQGDVETARSALREFSLNFDTNLTEFSDKIEELDAGQITSHSDAPGAMMIGLGQGGEWIVRATLAKLLNNNTDTRCQNLLKGLNIDMKEVKSSLDNDISNFDTKVPKGEAKAKYRPLLNSFDNANLLAINAGPEQAGMLNEPYNYIWGTIGEDNTKHVQRKDKFIRQSTNAILIDIGKDGSGGKMGKGRAYSANAEAAIMDTLREKKQGKNIRQICIVHSFAGGSGSGMILPVLRMVKQVMPGATIWVFSAGETAHGTSTHDSENVVYIASDVLQARYNALHYKEKEITTKEWKAYKLKSEKLYEDLNKQWDKISPHLISNKNQGKIKTEQEFKEHKSDLLQQLKEKINEEWKDDMDDSFVVNFKRILELDSGHDSFPDNVHEFVVDSDDETQQERFYKTVSDPVKANKAREIWTLYVELLEDKGSFALNPNNFDVEIEKSQSDSVHFKTQFAHLKYISKGIKHLSDSKGDHNQAQTTMEKEDYKQAIKPYAQLGVNAEIKHVEGSEKNFDADDLNRMLNNYATKMRKYHNHLSDFYEQIKLCLGATDDPLVKHVIVSNGHLDAGATEIARGRKNKYEMYNSIMVDTFVNLVHSLVANQDDEQINSTTMSNVSNNEVMDLNDMSGRTEPSTNATVLSMPDLVTTQNDIVYSTMESSSIEKEFPYKVLSMMFTESQSPFVDDEIVGSKNFVAPSTALKAFYGDFLRNKNGLRQFKVSDVIDSVNESDFRELAITDERFSKFWSQVKIKFNKEIEDRMIEYKFNESTAKNTINWIRFFGPRMVSFLFDSEEKRSQFDEYTKNWRSAWDKFYENPETHSPLNSNNRKTNISNMVETYAGGISTSNKSQMSEFLFEMGVIDGSHMAAIPSSLVYDYAPIIFYRVYRDIKYCIQTGDRETELQEQQLESFLPHIVLPSTQIQRTQPHAKWVKLREAYAKKLSSKDLNNVKLKIRHTSGLNEGLEPEYIRVVSNFSSPREVNYLDITPKFMSDFATLKEKTIRDYPEFGETTILNKLITVSSDINSSDHERTLAEKPVFRTATLDLEINSMPRLLHPTETKSSILFRTMFLGNSEHNERMTALYENNLANTHKTKWFTQVQNTNTQKYGDSFNPIVFDKSLEDRIEEFKTINLELPSEEFVQYAVLFRLQKLVREFNSSEKSFKSQTFFDKLFADLSNEIQSIVEEYSTRYNEVDLRKHCFDVLNLLSRLTSLSFAAHRQYTFTTDSSSKEYGVAFDFNGTLDAMRSMPNDWLWLVNASETIAASQLEKTLDYYHTNYLQSDEKLKGKVFIQNIQNGPLCSMTLVSQKAGFSEVSQKYSDLMDMLLKDGFKVIKGPLVHPYSFLRNILWLHTFQYAWVENPSPSFTRGLEIPNEIINNIFGKPEIIAEIESGLLHTGKMKGIDYSKYDTAMWNRAQRYVWKEINSETDKKAYKERMKHPIHITDMLLINYLKETAIEKGENFDDLFESPPSDIEEIYPSKFWKERLEKLQVRTDIISYLKNLKTSTSESIVENEELPGLGGLPGLDSLEENEPAKKSVSWKEALQSWKEFYEKSTENTD